MIMNRVTLIGNISKPEYRTSASGYPYLKMKLLEPGMEVDLTMEGKAAEKAVSVLQRGDLLLIDGKIKVREVNAKDGRVFRFTEVAIQSWMKLEEHVAEPASLTEQDKAFDEKTKQAVTAEPPGVDFIPF